MDTLVLQLYISASQETDYPLTADILLSNTTSTALLSAIHDEHNLNLTANQLELLALHWKFSHLGMNNLKYIIHPAVSQPHFPAPPSRPHLLIYT
eukprot:14968527-Ditylum_brightwellii.AAC.1